MNKFADKVSLTPEEKKKYALPTELDFEIMFKIQQLEKLNLSKEDKFLVEFIKSQLEYDWRTPLVKELDKVSAKYNK